MWLAHETAKSQAHETALRKSAVRAGSCCIATASPDGHAQMGSHFGWGDGGDDASRPFVAQGLFPGLHAQPPLPSSHVHLAPHPPVPPCLLSPTLQGTSGWPCASCGTRRLRGGLHDQLQQREVRLPRPPLHVPCSAALQRLPAMCSGACGRPRRLPCGATSCLRGKHAAAGTTGCKQEGQNAGMALCIARFDVRPPHLHPRCSTAHAARRLRPAGRQQATESLVLHAAGGSVM